MLLLSKIWWEYFPNFIFLVSVEASSNHKKHGNSGRYIHQYQRFGVSMMNSCDFLIMQNNGYPKNRTPRLKAS